MGGGHRLQAPPGPWVLFDRCCFDTVIPAANPLHPLLAWQLDLEGAQGWRPFEGFPQLFQKHWPGSRGWGHGPSRATKLLGDLGQTLPPLCASNSSLSDGGAGLERGLNGVLVLLREPGGGTEREAETKSVSPAPTSPLPFPAIRKQPPAYQDPSSAHPRFK